MSTSQHNSQEKPLFVGATWCGWTRKQFAELQQQVDFKNKVDICMEDREVKLDDGYVIPKCTEEQAARIKGFPHWKINGEDKPGFIPIDKLKELMSTVESQVESKEVVVKEASQELEADFVPINSETSDASEVKSELKTESASSQVVQNVQQSISKNVEIIQQNNELVACFPLQGSNGDITKACLPLKLM